MDIDNLLMAKYSNGVNIYGRGGIYARSSLKFDLNAALSWPLLYRVGASAGRPP